MMFKMIFRDGNEMVFHEWNTLKADLMYEYGYVKHHLYNVLESLVGVGVYKDAAAYIKKDIDFSEIRVIDDVKIENPQYFCETWLLTSDQTNAAYPTLREAVDFARHNHDFLASQEEDYEETDTEHDDEEAEQMVKDAAGNVVFEITFDGKEKEKNNGNM